jgi:hypothetical protein
VLARRGAPAGLPARGVALQLHVPAVLLLLLRELQQPQLQARALRVAHT